MSAVIWCSGFTTNLDSLPIRSPTMPIALCTIAASHPCRDSTFWAFRGFRRGGPGINFGNDEDAGHIAEAITSRVAYRTPGPQTVGKTGVVRRTRFV